MTPGAGVLININSREIIRFKISTSRAFPVITDDMPMAGREKHVVTLFAAISFKVFVAIPVLASNSSQPQFRMPRKYLRQLACQSPAPSPVLSLWARRSRKLALSAFRNDISAVYLRRKRLGNKFCVSWLKCSSENVCQKYRCRGGRRKCKFPEKQSAKIF